MYHDNLKLKKNSELENKNEEIKKKKENIQFNKKNLNQGIG